MISFNARSVVCGAAGRVTKSSIPAVSTVCGAGYRSSNLLLITQERALIRDGAPAPMILIHVLQKKFDVNEENSTCRHGYPGWPTKQRV